MQITANNNGSLKEIMANKLADLKAKHKYLTSKIKGGDSLRVEQANNRGFVIAMDYSRNPSMGFMNADGGNLVTPGNPALDRMTASLQYIQFGQEISNLQLANSLSGARVGPAAKALAARKMLERRAEAEEWFFCRGDGTQQIADITGSVTAVLDTEVTVATAGTRDGAGSYLLSVNQRVRIYTSALVYKSKGYVSAKTANTSFGYTATAITTAGIVDTDIVLPESDTTTPTTTGIKGLPYLVKASGSFFDKTLSATPSLKAVVDSSTTTFSRATLEALAENHVTRAGEDVDTRAVTSFAQRANYYQQFYSTFTPATNVIGDQRAQPDMGGKRLMQYTFWGQPIEAFVYIHPKYWYNLTFSSFARLTLKEAGRMLTPQGEFVPKISSGVYANAQQQWDDDFLEYLTDSPHENSCMSALTFSGLPGLLKDSTYTGN
jgi:hypothetical protein